MSPATFNPNEKWVLQQARNAAMWLDDIEVSASHLIRDRDGKFADSFDGFWECSVTEIVKTPPRTPQANGYSESYISTIKAQFLNHFFCGSLEQLDYNNREWRAYYNEQRPHQGIDIGYKVLCPELCPASQWHPCGTRQSARFPFASQPEITSTEEARLPFIQNDQQPAYSVNIG